MESTASKPHLHSRSGVRIVGKIRPFLDSEIVQSSGGESSSSSSNRPHISLTRIDGEHASIAFADQSTGRKETYKLDWCYQQEEHVDEIFSREVKPLLQGIFHGCNACVIAYGAGGSGKTQIIQGSQEKPGLAPSAVSEILSLAKEMGILVTMSCYEVYQDHVYDLLEPKEHEVHVLEDAGWRIQLKGLSQVPVKSISDFEKFYFHGCNLRNPSQKGLNGATYKSHRGLLVYVSHVDKKFKNSLIGKMNFVDLAGYMDTKQKKPHLSENKSLYALLKVAYALNNNETHVPYRESKLTRLLQDFIGRASRALLISCLNPTSCQDTIRAVSLASRSCQVVNQHRHDSTKKNKSCPRLVPSYPTSQVLNTPVKRHVFSQFGSIERKTNATSSITKRSRHQPLCTSVKKGTASQVGSIEKKADDTSSMIKGMKFFHAMGPMTNSVQDSITSDGATTANTVIKDSISSDVATAVNTIVKGTDVSSVQALEPSIPKEDDCPSNERNNVTSTDAGPQIGAEIFMDLPDSIIEKDQNSAINFGKSSPPISERLREISNSLKLLSCQPLSMDPKTPGVLFHLRLDNTKNDNTCTPQSIFKTRSTCLKKSLVQECLTFLNSASKEELKGIKGIGEKRAACILQHREANLEPFKELDDLKDVGLSSKEIKRLMSNILGEF